METKLLNIAVLGSSFARRTRLVDMTWNFLKKEFDDTPILGCVVDPPPPVSAQKWLDLDIRERVLVWQEGQESRELMNMMLKNGVDVGVMFSPYTAFGFMVDRILENHRMAQEISKKALVGTDGKPMYSEEEKARMAEANMLGSGTALLQTIILNMYPGFWSHIFLLESEEDKPTLVDGGGGRVLPIGTREQCQHYYYTKFVEMFGLQVVTLPSDITEAAKMLCEIVCYETGFKEDDKGGKTEEGNGNEAEGNEGGA